MRSLLAVPATNPRFLEKAAQSDADAIFIDLEDAVVPELKVEARALAITAINTLDWGGRQVGVRVNDLSTPWATVDLVELAESCPRLDRVILPKCESPGDVSAADALLRAGEKHANRPIPIQLDALVESARGVAQVEATAAMGGRLAGMIFGSGDYSLDLGVIEGGDFDFAMARIANACRAWGLTPVDGPYFSITDPEGLRAACARAATLGYAGKMAIHPSQVAIINEMFSPSAAQVQWANEVLDAMKAAGEQGRGAVKTKDGRMIDLVHIKIARQVLERAQRNPSRR